MVLYGKPVQSQCRDLNPTTTVLTAIFKLDSYNIYIVNSVTRSACTSWTCPYTFVVVQRMDDKG
jgi:hypothetical protein